MMLKRGMQVKVEIKGHPLLKWPGGKRDLVNRILPFVPLHFNRYFEPFFGGGALFFALQPKRAYLSDKNSELMQAYVQVRDRPDAVIKHLRQLRNSEKDYYKVRSSRPTGGPARAARLIYLMTLSFNGIYRVNLNGVFNVPYGYKTYLDPCDEERLRNASNALKKARVRNGDFERIICQAKKDDLVYLDPPYTVAHGNNGFVKYNAKIFSWEDQIRLAHIAEELANRGCTVIVSNADHSSIRALYKAFKTTILERTSRIAASRDFRSGITECIFTREAKHQC